MRVCVHARMQRTGAHREGPYLQRAREVLEHIERAEHDVVEAQKNKGLTREDVQPAVQVHRVPAQRRKVGS